MLPYTVYSEAGGVGKTTLAANLAVAHARADLDVLVIPLDPQDGDLSHLFDIDHDRADADADHIVRHLVEREKGDFADLVHHDIDHPGVDVIPEHNMLDDLEDVLQREADSRSDFGESFPKYTQLLRVLRENDVDEAYDVVIMDPQASPGAGVYNAIAASGNLVLPVEPSAKGQASVNGLEDLVSGLSEELEIGVGVLAAVPNGFGGTNDQTEILEAVRDLGYDVPVVFRQRSSLFEGCWRQHCSAFTYVREHRDRKRDHEMDTLAKFDELARHIERQGGIEVPNPPEPGELEELAEV
mgnify:CR=1 FL=1